MRGSTYTEEEALIFGRSLMEQELDKHQQFKSKKKRKRSLLTEDIELHVDGDRIADSIVGRTLVDSSLMAVHLLQSY